jgi:hypothetical protein
MTNLETPAEAVQYFLRLMKAHPGEGSYGAYLAAILTSPGVPI